jgi:hypothetical protein
MNRTIKEEFCLDHTLKSKLQTYESVKEAIWLYNNYRPHQSLSLKTPIIVIKKPNHRRQLGAFKTCQLILGLFMPL